MGVQLILYPQVYDGYYSWTAYGNNSKSTGVSTGGGGAQPKLANVLVSEFVGNANLAGKIYGTATDIGTQPTGSGVFASNLLALRTAPAPIGQWRMSYTNNITLANLPKLQGGLMYFSTEPSLGTTTAYTTVNNLQAGNTYRILVTIESGPPGELRIGSTGGTSWEETVPMNGKKSMRQAGGPRGTDQNGNDWIKADNGMYIGNPLQSSISSQARYYQNFTAQSDIEVLQLSFLATNASQTPLVVSTISVVAAPLGPTSTISTNGSSFQPPPGGAINVGPSNDTLMETFLDDGQVILDLYKDETIPLNLSADDFTSVDEKIASYSKAFMIPATKHNNKIFSFYFDVSRSQNQDVFFFNPFAKTKAKIKDDTVLVFEGWMKLINVQEKNGQISYNINLYSEPTTFCDYLKAGIIADLDLFELGHNYYGNVVEDSWDNAIGTPLTSPLQTSSPAYEAALGPMRTNVIKYPFINWSGNFELLDPTTFAINKQEDVFRPVISCKYLIEKMFEATPFTFESNFLNSSKFKNLFMDFNYGGDGARLATDVTMGSDQLVGSPVTTGTNFQHVILTDVLEDQPSGTAYQHYDPVTGQFVILDNDTTFKTWGSPRFKRTEFDTDGEWQLIYVPGPSSPGTGVPQVLDSGAIKWNNSWNTLTVNFSVWPFFLGSCNTPDMSYASTSPIDPGGNYGQCGAGRMEGNFHIKAGCQPGDVFFHQFRNSTGIGEIYQSTNADIPDGSWNPEPWKDAYNNEEFNTLSYQLVGGDSTISFLLKGLRGRMKQYDFWSGIKNMFNLITIPDKTTPNHLIIEPYADIFLNNPLTKQLDWTDRLDASSIKTTPLNKIPKSTTFSYIKDEGDYRLKVYGNALGGYLYGSKTYEAGNQFFSLLTGNKKIEAKPFAPTLAAPLTMLWPSFIISHIYGANDEGTEFKSFDNKPRILYDQGKRQMPAGITYRINHGLFGPNGYPPTPNPYYWDQYGLMTHLELTPPGPGSYDLNFGECPLVAPLGSSPIAGLFNLYWKPYYDALYNPDCRVVALKAKLTPQDINEFNFYDTIIVKNREYRVNKIQYSSGALAVLELILIP